MSSQNRKGKFQKRKSGKFQSGNKGGGKLPLLIALAVLLVVAAVLIFWLTHVGGTPPAGTSESTAGESQQLSNSQPEPSDETRQGEGDPADTGQTQTGVTEASTTPADTGGSEQSGGESSTKPTSGSNTGSNNDSTKQTEPDNEFTNRDALIACDEYSLFSGQFVEDGKDNLVSNVATILVTNNSDQFLDLATIMYLIDGKTATFVVTGLPAGRSAWVLESSKLTATASSTFTYVDKTTSFRENVSATSDKVTITADGNMLTATNNSDEALEGVFIYDRSVHTDGNFLGGITYLVDFGTLEPGASVEKMGGHYSEDSEIIRIGWS